MRDIPRLTSAVTGRHVVIALGALYVVLAGLSPLISTGDDISLEIIVLAALLIGAPGAILFFGGYLLPQSDIHSSLYDRIAGWSLAGAGVMIGILLLTVLADSTTEIVYNILILSALGSCAGFGIGLFDAKSRTRAVEAEQRNRELEYQNNRLKNFSRMVAHELRNPLMLAKGYHEQSQPRNEAASEKVEDAHGRIEEMIDILLVTVRGADVDVSGKQVDIGEVATKVWADLGSKPESASLDLETDRVVQSDPVHLQHLLANLFRNSIEHSDGAVTVRVRDFEDGFYVEDEGPGIPAETRSNVLEAGYTTSEQGTGLGLTVVTHLAEIYEWDWDLTDSEAGGVRFEFTNVEFVSAGNTE